MANKRWVFPERVPEEKINALVQRLHILPMTAAILAGRGLEGQNARYFFDPSGLRLRDFRDLPGTPAAGERIAKAIREKEKIVIFGDYDVDGITASAVLTEFIRQRQGDCEVYLPNRMLEGYGLNPQAMDKVVKTGAKLLITVDCGITATQEIKLLKQNSLDVIITDHHEPGSEVPPADVIVNPKLTGPEDLELLAGVGVILQVVRATADALGEKDSEQLRQHLDLVAFGTVADVVPLWGENRSLVRAGLAVMNRGNRPGLRALAKSAGRENGSLTSTDLAFRLAPRMNAAGRLGDAQAAFDLLLTQDAQTAQDLAQFLNQQNSERRNIEQTVLNEAEQMVGSFFELPNAIVVSNPAWPIGVLGLAASRLSERYFRPCFVLSEKNGEAKGSGRSIPGFSLPEALNASSEYLEKWGGHHMAAGVTLRTENIEAFRQSLEKIAKEKLKPEDKQPQLCIDAQVDLLDITPQFIKELKQFEPFGYKNTRPILHFSRMQVCLPPRLVGERHVKFKVSAGRKAVVDVIGFGLGERMAEINCNNLIDIVGHASENVWNNTTTLQIEMKDFRYSTEREK